LPPTNIPKSNQLPYQMAKTLQIHCYMEKRILLPRRALQAALIILLLGAAGMTKAGPVDVRTARQVGAKFINANTATRVASDQDLRLATTYRTSNGTAAFHVFNMSEGWVIVAADNCATPILAYSTSGQFDGNNLPPAMQNYLMGFVEQIGHGIDSHLPALDTVAHQWELVQATGLLRDDRSPATAVAPLLTTAWGTTYPYNSLCPADPNGYVGHVETGSPALAMGQIMRYWCYPFKGSGSHSYIPQNYPSQPQSVDFGNTIYDWDNMPNSLNSSSPAAQINAVATLLWHCGVSMNIDYSLMGCGAYPNDIVAAMRDYFNYSSDLHYDSQSDYTDSQWINKLKTDLDNGRPVLYSGLDTDNYYVHAFVCDGYNSSNQLHFNWGWNGTYQDAYFALGTLTPYPGFDFSASNHAIFEIHPNCTSGTTYQVSATAYPNNYGTVSGTGTYSCGNLCTLTATANPGYEFINWTKDGEVVSTNPTHNFAVTEGASFVANFAQEGIITFADANVKAICVTYWDTDDDGELSYAEAAVVTFLDEMFRGNGGITSFDELQYFTGMTSIESVFMDCSSLTSVVIPNSVTDIQFAFSGCSSLTSIEIPNSVNTIGDYAFENCYSLNSVIIGNSVTSIGVYAFYGCQDLTSITIPNSVEHIGDFAFYDCSNLASMTVLAVNPPTLATEALVGLNTQIPVYVPCESVGVYVNEAWGGFSNFIGLCAAGEITATADPAEGGTVTGAGSYAGGVICTLTATANEGYTFINWMENGQQVSTDPTYSFIVDGDASYVAKFAQGNVITFADAHVKALCVAHWDTDGDGELSYAEAAAVTDISGVFSLDPESSPGDPDVTSFDELQYFTGLTALGAFAFAGCSNLSSIIIPNSVTNLELYVFAGCSSLTTIEIPNSVDFIGGYAFADCSGLISVIIGNSVTTIGEFAFGSCSSLTSIEIPNSVTNIENDAFEGCIGLEQIDVESGNTVYDSRENCNAIIETTTNKLLTGCINTIIPNSVTSIEDDAFGGCNLTSITIPSSVTYIGYYAFANCQGLTSMTVLADTPPVLGADAFFHVNTQIPVYVPCWSVEEYVNAAWGDFINFIGLCTITFADANVKAICVENWDTDGDGELSYAEAAAVTNLNRVFKDNTTITSFDELQYFTGLTSLQVHEFSRCSSLSSIVIPDSVTTIGAWAFNHCTSLTSIVIPNSVTALDGGIVFSGSGLEQIIVESGNTVYDSRENCNAIIETSTNKLVVGCKNTVIPNSVTSIGTTAFSHCSGLTTIEIPNSVGSIGSSAFSSSGLTTIEIPNSVGSIGSYAFSDCSNLVSVEIPSSLGDIASYLFENCSSLSSIKIPNSVVYIDDHAFVNCSGMTSAIIGNSVANIGDGAFDYCSGLTSLTVLADQPPMLNSDSLFFFYFVNHDIPVYIPCGSEDNYTHSFWSDFNNFIELTSTITLTDAQM
jgi:Flp pilus assembly protein protease CpaA